MKKITLNKLQEWKDKGKVHFALETPTGKIDPEAIVDYNEKSKKVDFSKVDFAVCILEEELKRLQQQEGYYNPLDGNNKTGKCHLCKRTVSFRPHLPDKLRKLCNDCTVAYVENLRN